jgi:hypothetical protein
MHRQQKRAEFFPKPIEFGNFGKNSELFGAISNSE